MFISPFTNHPPLLSSQHPEGSATIDELGEAAADIAELLTAKVGIDLVVSREVV